MKTNQKGFALPHLLLVIIALAMVGGVGYYVYRANQDINKNLDTTVTSQNDVQKIDKRTEETSTEDNPPASDEYLEIKEYGVKIKLTDGIKDAYYVMNTYPYLSVRSLDKFRYCKMSENDQNGSVAAISKAKVGDDHFGSPWTKSELEERASLNVGDTYYWVELSNGGSCTDPTGNNSDEKETTARREFGNAQLLEL